MLATYRSSFDDGDCIVHVVLQDLEEGTEVEVVRLYSWLGPVWAGGAEVKPLGWHDRQCEVKDGLDRIA
jgi:hypothetical protein